VEGLLRPGDDRAVGQRRRDLEGLAPPGHAEAIDPLLAQQVVQLSRQLQLQTSLQRVPGKLPGDAPLPLQALDPEREGPIRQRPALSSGI
jgi:hypothetical protein